MVEERTMLLKKSYFSDISLTKQKILQRRHFISAAIRQRTQAGLLKPYEFLQVQESRPVSFIKFDSAFDPVANCRHEPASVIRQRRLSSGRCLGSCVFRLKRDRVAFVG